MRTLLFIFLYSCAIADPSYRVTDINTLKDGTHVIKLRRLGEYKVIRIDCLPDTIYVGKKVKL